MAVLGDHFKRGQRLSVQNRPTEVASRTEIALSCRLLTIFKTGQRGTDSTVVTGASACEPYREANRQHLNS
jgi:hypothetical protein